MDDASSLAGRFVCSSECRTAEAEDAPRRTKSRPQG
jgi:hypothetical protein